MTPEYFDALFDTFHVTAVRLETLPAYAVADYEGDRLDAYLAGRPLPVRTVATDPWLARIATTTLAGKQWSRIRVLDEPLTDYQRFELAVFPETQAVGETIRIVPRGAVTLDGPDFWLFDGDTAAARAVVMSYGPDGQWLGAELAEDPETVATCVRRLRATAAVSVPLNAYLAVAHG